MAIHPGNLPMTHPPMEVKLDTKAKQMVVSWPDGTEKTFICELLQVSGGVTSNEVSLLLRIA
jgi:DUF971 family protein